MWRIQWFLWIKHTAQLMTKACGYVLIGILSCCSLLNYAHNSRHTFLNHIGICKDVVMLSFHFVKYGSCWFHEAPRSMSRDPNQGIAHRYAVCLINKTSEPTRADVHSIQSNLVVCYVPRLTLCRNILCKQRCLRQCSKTSTSFSSNCVLIYFQECATLLEIGEYSLVRLCL